MLRPPLYPTTTSIRSPPLRRFCFPLKIELQALLAFVTLVVVKLLQPVDQVRAVRFEQDYRRKLEEVEALHLPRKESNSSTNGKDGNKKPETLGVAGIALQYANLITQMDNIASRPISLPPNTRDNLYNGLPTNVNDGNKKPETLLAILTTDDGRSKVKDDMVAARERGWKGLRGMGFGKSTSIFLASGRINDSERHMAPLLEMFPLLQTKEMLASTEELAPFKV
ncbi:hypothetical protein L2E82_52431 [Cichorium intybus]|nr:hypothetical protein L2E82_52431 [Cichorium intybus]